MPNADGSLTLQDVAGKTDTLVLACNRCERAGHYPVATLVERYGQTYPIPTLLKTLSADCPKRASVLAFDICGVHCPDLSKLFAVHVQAKLQDLEW